MKQGIECLKCWESGGGALDINHRIAAIRENLRIRERHPNLFAAPLAARNIGRGLDKKFRLHLQPKEKHRVDH